jgi:hypothetical protein
MEKEGLPQLLNLNFFIHEVWTPGVRLLGRKDLTRFQGAVKPDLLDEAVGWLRLGTQVGFFPKREAALWETLCYNELFPSGGERQGRSSGRTGQGDDFVPSFDEPRRLGPLFRGALIGAKGLASDPLCRAFLVAVRFVDDKRWNSLTVDAEMDADQIGRVQFLEESVDPRNIPVVSEVVYAAFLWALDHIDGIRELFHDCTSPELNETDVLILQRQVLSLMRWRIDTRKARNRFLQLIESVNKSVRKEILQQTHRDRATADVFKERATQLIKYWSDEEEVRALSASAPN